MNTTRKLLVGTFVLAAMGGGVSVSAANGYGMTWTKTGIDAVYGVVDVGCGYTPGVANQCNPYTGDTPCAALLPLLCFYDAGLSKPAGLITSSNHEWAGGVVATTVPVAGSSFRRVTDANRYCEQTFGSGWRVAEFHDGAQWYFMAYGNVGNTANEARRRLWVDIIGQPAGTCWTR